MLIGFSIVTNYRGTEYKDKANDLFEICLLHNDAFDNYRHHI